MSIEPTNPPESPICAITPPTPNTEDARPEAEPVRGRRSLVVHGTGAHPDSWFPQLVRTAQNAAGSLANSAAVSVVVQGPGVALLATDSTATGESVRSLVAQGVRVIACGNSLAAINLLPDALVTGVEVEPAAIAFLAERQWAGAAYVRI